VLRARGGLRSQSRRATDGSRFRQDFLQLEKRWLELAQSIQFGESLDTFTKNSAKSNIKPSNGQ